jgi:hypothetical protein
MQIKLYAKKAAARLDWWFRQRILLTIAAWVLEYYGDRACWARLVIWALFDTSQDQFWFAVDVRQCRQDADEIFGDCCYCGHVRFDVPYIGLRFILTGRQYD